MINVTTSKHCIHIFNRNFYTDVELIENTYKNAKKDIEWYNITPN